MDWQHFGSYVVGQCTDFVESTLTWVPNNLGNAGDWLANAKAQGFKTESTPHVGDVVVYGPGGGYSPYGHVGIVTDVLAGGQFKVREGNYKGPGIADIRTSTMADVEGFIMPNVAPGQQVRSGIHVNFSGGTPSPSVPVVSGVGDAFSNLGSGVHDGIDNLTHSSGIDAVGNFLKLVGSTEFWWRAGFVIAGIVVVLIGIAALAKVNPVEVAGAVAPK